MKYQSAKTFKNCSSLLETFGLRQQSCYVKSFYFLDSLSLTS